MKVSSRSETKALPVIQNMTLTTNGLMEKWSRQIGLRKLEKGTHREYSSKQVNNEKLKYESDEGVEHDKPYRMAHDLRKWGEKPDSFVDHKHMLLGMLAEFQSSCCKHLGRACIQQNGIGKRHRVTNESTTHLIQQSPEWAKWKVKVGKMIVVDGAALRQTEWKPPILLFSCKCRTSMGLSELFKMKCCHNPLLIPHF